MSGSLANRLVQAAELLLIDHTPGDEHTKPAARKAVAATLRALADDCEKRVALVGGPALRELAEVVERGEQQ